jgi:catechol 2,3-dioxygenase-like lactoylglutathione lyase family enzyme
VAQGRETNGGPTYPRAFAHVGITVTDLARAIDWYGSVLGFELLMGPVEVWAGDGDVGQGAADVFGPDFRRFRQAHMSAGNGVVVEIFEFLEPRAERRDDNFEYWKTGFFHVCVVDRDVEGLVQRIAETGGRMRTSRIWPIFPGQKYRFCYCEDPFGNIVEIYSHSHEQTFANQDHAAPVAQPVS